MIQRRPLRKPARKHDRHWKEGMTMTATNWVNENKGLWLAVVCGVTAFGLLNTVLGSMPVERAGMITITQVLDDDLGSMVVSAARPSDSRVARDNGSTTKRGKKGESTLQLAVGF
jgi:hypothetical protein